MSETSVLIRELFGDEIPIGAISAVNGDFTLPVGELRQKLEAFIIRDYKRLLKEPEAPDPDDWFGF